MSVSASEIDLCYLPLKRYGAYRLTGMEHTGICGMGHTVLVVNSEGVWRNVVEGCFDARLKGV